MPENSPNTAPPGYQDVSIPLTKIVMSGTLLSVVLLIIPLILFAEVHGVEPLVQVWTHGVDWLIGLAALVLGIAAHELVHAVGWKLAGGLRWRDLSFGIDRKTFSPYCHARVPMRAAAYRIGAVLPAVLTGVVPIAVGLIWAEPMWVLIGAFLFSAAIGDFIVLWVIRGVPAQALVLDHPSNAGCYAQIS
jgi:hypothetical protein